MERKKAEELLKKQQHLKTQQQGYNMIIKLGDKNKQKGAAAASSWGSVRMARCFTDTSRSLLLTQPSLHQQSQSAGPATSRSWHRESLWVFWWTHSRNFSCLTSKT